MKKVLVRYLNEKDEVLMQETILRFDIPPIGTQIQWMKIMWEVDGIPFEDWDNKRVDVTLKQL